MTTQQTIYWLLAKANETTHDTDQQNCWLDEVRAELGARGTVEYDSKLRKHVIKWGR